MHVRSLSHSQCSDLLAANSVGRLACSDSGRPYVVPIYYAYLDHYAYAFTMSGRKLTIMRTNPQVALLVDKAGAGRGWKSVLAEGRFEELTDASGLVHERDRAWTLLSKRANWWEPGAFKPDPSNPSDHAAHAFFRIHIDEMSGREALGGDETSPRSSRRR